MSKETTNEKETKVEETEVEVNIERDDVEKGSKKAKKAKKKELTPLEEKELEICKLQKELEEAKAAEQKAKDDLLRKVAEVENFRKRLIRDKEDSIQFANNQLICDLLQSLDDFDRAITASESARDFDKIHDGVVMVNDKLHTVLEKNWGLKKLECVGEEFDPSKHEAYMMEQSDEYDKEVVLLELGAGYTLHDRVIRPAKVKVGKPN
ncbi:MAG: nucleotide exchange factor GrpE [Pleomorphochaeta sp.]